MKVYISQPMANKSKEEILEERERFKKAILNIFPDAEFLPTYFEDYDTEKMSPLDYLAENVSMMAKADLVVTLPMYMSADGCGVEDHIAQVYGIPRFGLDYRFGLNGEYKTL